MRHDYRERALWLILAACLTACAPEGSASAPSPEADSDSTAATDAAPSSSTPEPPAPPPPAPALPGLSPLGSAEMMASLGSEPSCRLVDEAMTLVAVLGDQAVVNDGGKIVRLRRQGPSANVPIAGGRFVARRLEIEVRPGAQINRDRRLIERDSSVSIVRGRRGFSVSHGPVWACRVGPE